MVVEVSGALGKISLDNRKKICKNLKAMYKHIASEMKVSSVTLTKKLKLYNTEV